jgi:uncharacterized coiled-coil DUF342 family protein
MNYLRDTQKKVQETITYTENVSIMTENFIGANTVRKLIEEYHKLHDDLENKSESFKKEIRDLSNLVQGGKQLDKLKDCDICQTF